MILWVLPCAVSSAKPLAHPAWSPLTGTCNHAQGTARRVNGGVISWLSGTWTGSAPLTSWCRILRKRGISLRHALMWVMPLGVRRLPSGRVPEDRGERRPERLNAILSRVVWSFAGLCPLLTHGVRDVSSSRASLLAQCRSGGEMCVAAWESGCCTDGRCSTSPVHRVGGSSCLICLCRRNLLCSIVARAAN
jgi:hypothetical protein